MRGMVIVWSFVALPEIVIRSLLEMMDAVKAQDAGQVSCKCIVTPTLIRRLDGQTGPTT